VNKLQAVNRCLRAIGESPVSSLASGVPDAEDAEAVVDEITEEVLSAGWHENTSFDVKLQPNVFGQIRVPDDYLRIDTTGVSYHIDVTVRKDPSDDLHKLFLVKEQTFDIEEDLYVDIVHSFDFDSLSYTIQNYIAAKSARIYQQQTMSSVALDQFVVRAEAEAWAKLLDAEADAEDNNILTDSRYMREVVGRHNYLSWR